MLVSKERAEYLAQLSYKYCSHYNMMENLITYKKAMEYDSKTAEYVIIELELEVDKIKMDKYLLNINAKASNFGSELIEIDNYQYVESYEYEYDKMTRPNSLTVTMHEGESFVLTTSQSFVPSSDQIYAPNIYGDLFPNKDKNGVTILPDSREWELYLKLLINEDRLINPYRIYFNPGGTHTVLAMKEPMKWIKDYEVEITLINKVLSKLNSRLISGYNKSTSMLFEVKPTVLYLESIGEEKLAQEVRDFNNKEKELVLNYVLQRATDLAYGLVVLSEKTNLVLL